MTSPEPPILIIGAGLAGLFLALKLAPRRVILASPSPLGTSSSSAWAQGGLAAALDPEDSPSAHALDTTKAGAGLTDPNIALLLAQDGPARVKDLLALGVPFDTTETGALALSLEAAHSRPRVARVAGDLAGKAIIDALTTAVIAAGHIEIFQPAKAVALLQSDAGTIVGAAFKTGQSNAIETLSAGHVILSTGGIGGLFRVTTNPRSSLGDGLAMAANCGAMLADLEFIQFHPTAMDFGADPAPLATEALRGEGAQLVDETGQPFMKTYHPKGGLAPRDIVARAISSQIETYGNAFLDARSAIGHKFPQEFPTVFEACQKHSIDPRTDLIPIMPAVHYHMGGIVCDIWGQSTLEGLSVAGECASTGAHGGNRLASNSLLEAIVFSSRIADALLNTSMPAPSSGQYVAPSAMPRDALKQLRAFMTEHCGVNRSAEGLQKLTASIAELQNQFGETHPLRVARLIAESALRRRESRGAHNRTDYPDGKLAARGYVLDGMRASSIRT